MLSDSDVFEPVEQCRLRVQTTFDDTVLGIGGTKLGAELRQKESVDFFFLPQTAVHLNRAINLARPIVSKIALFCIFVFRLLILMKFSAAERSLFQVYP